jgi:hypothetical protein
VHHDEQPEGTALHLEDRTTKRAPMTVGTAVRVWNSYLEAWTSGFAVAGVAAFGYRLRRLSDGQVFEDVFPFTEVLPERRHEQLPGIAGTYLDRRQSAWAEDEELVPPRE